MVTTKHTQFVKKLKTHLKESYRLASQNAKKIADKTRFDQRFPPSVLETGDRGLVRAVHLRGKHKLANKWETNIHVLVQQAGVLPVYTIWPEKKEGPLRNVHRNLLLPCGFIPAATETEQPALPKPRKYRTRQSKVPDPEEDMLAYSDAEDDIVVNLSSAPPT